MRFIRIAVLLIAMAPQHGVEPPKGVYCSPTHKDPNHRCGCLNQDKGAGCKEGKRDTEMTTCKHYCWAPTCACCLS